VPQKFDTIPWRNVCLTLAHECGFGARTEKGVLLGAGKYSPWIGIPIFALLSTLLDTNESE